MWSADQQDAAATCLPSQSSAYLAHYGIASHCFAPRHGTCTGFPRSITAQAHAHTLTSVCACALRNSASREHGASAPHLDCEEIQTYYCIQLYHRDLNDMSCSAMRNLNVHYVAGTLSGYACAAAPPPDEDRRCPTERNYSPDVTNLADITLEPDANLWRMHRLILRSTQQRSYASC